MKAADVHIDLDAIPEPVWQALAASTLELIKSILAQPGGRELLDAEKERMRKEKRNAESA